MYPADAALGPSLAGVGAVVLVHGGRVAPARYEWLAVHLASQVALDALRSVSEADGVLAGLVAADGPAVVTGHSLGGEDAVGRPVLALGGTEDGLLPPDRMADEVARFAGPVWFGLVDGLNHFGWTDDPSAQELDGDGGRWPSGAGDADRCGAGDRSVRRRGVRRW